MDIINLMRSYVNNEQLNIEINDDDLKFLIEQSLQTLIYPVTQNKSYKKHYISWVLKQEQFFNLQNEMTDLFNKSSINHLYFKGSVLAKLYDDPSVRTRGDIDIYVTKEQFEEAKKILLNNGYQSDDSTTDCLHHAGFKKNGIEVELHFDMFDPDSDKSWIKIFSEPLSLCDKVDNSLYEFKPTYHLIYCIMHFAHHLRGGAGLRYILDYYYMFKKTSIDFDLLHKTMKDCNLSRLYSNIINAIRQIFDVEFDNSIPKEDVTFFIDYMKESGIHGFSREETHQSSIHNNKFKFLLHRAFLKPKQYRVSMYPRLGAHWYSYPICLIVHWFYLITHKIGGLFKLLFGRNKNKKLYKKLGI